MRLFVFVLILIVPGVALADEARLYAWSSASGGYRPEGPALGGQAQLAASYKLWCFLEPEVIVGTGAYIGTNEYLQRFSFGTRLLLPNLGVTPFVWLALSHVHEAPLVGLIEEPIGTVLSMSDVGVRHRTGGEAGLGVLVPFEIDDDDAIVPRVELMVRGTAIYLPGFGVAGGDHTTPSHLYLLGEIGIGVPVSLPEL